MRDLLDGVRETDRALSTGCGGCSSCCLPCVACEQGRGGTRRVGQQPSRVKGTPGDEQKERDIDETEPADPDETELADSDETELADLDEEPDDGPDPDVLALESMSVAALLALARELWQPDGRPVAVLAELRRRRSRERRGLLPSLLVDTNLDPDVRLRLVRMALREDRPTVHTAWWLMMHTEYGWFEYEEHRYQLVDMLGELDSDQSGEGEALTAILANDYLEGRLRALAGAELMELLGQDALPLLQAHLGDELVPLMEVAARDDEVSDVLLNLAGDTKAEPDLRLEAAAAIQRLYTDLAEETFAELAVADGLTVDQRLEALQAAVEAADSAAATAALDILMVVAEPDGSRDDDGLSLALKLLRNER